MRKTVTLLLTLAVMAAGSCTPDEILITDEAISSDGSSLIDPELSWSASSCEATIDSDANEFPTLVNTKGVSVTYTSSDTAVASVDGDGSITLLSAGTTSIMATSAATDKYSASSASYALTVYKGDGISWSASTCTVTYGDESTYSFPHLNNPGSQAIAYSSSNELVATISSAGTITVVAEGETSITATSTENDAYGSASVSFTLSVEGNLEKAGISWSADSYTAILASDENVFPTLSNPNGLTVTYSSSNTDVATVNDSGEVTPIAAGTISIIATTEADDQYAAGSASYTLKVVKHDVTLSWSATSCTQTLEEEDTGAYPTLTADPSAISGDVRFESSNVAVATVSSTGSITLVGTGSATISAIFEGNDIYKAASAAYTLSVKTNTDDGAGTWNYSSTGDSSSEDDVVNTTFTRMVTVTYSSSGASVSGYSASSDITVAVSGNGVTISNTGSENVIYHLTGTASDGYFKLYSAKKMALLLDGVSITNSAGAAINIQSGKRCFVLVEGTNTLADGSSAAYSSGDEDMKAVFFSEGQLCFSGSGSLKVTANNKKSKAGIASDDYLRFMQSPTVTVTSGSSAGHGIRANDYVRISSGKLNVSTAAAMKKGISSDDYVLVEGGVTTITVTGGVAYDSDDKEYKGSAGIKADNYFGMTGGTLTITNSGVGGKGIRAGSDDYNETGVIEDSYISGGTLTITTTGSESNDVSSKGIKIGWANGTENKVTANDGGLKISGGVIKVSSSKSEGVEAKDAFTMTGGEVYVTSTGDDAVNCVGEMKISGGYIYANSSKNDALDSNSNLTLSGGYVFAVTTAGGAEVAIDCAEQKTLTISSGVTMVAYPSIESGATMNQTCYTMSCTAGTWNALHNGSSYIAAFKAPSGVSSVVVSAPSLKSGYKNVSVGSTTYCNGIWATSSISGGTSVSLSGYSGGGTAGGGPGGGGFGGGGFGHH